MVRSNVPTMCRPSSSYSPHVSIVAFQALIPRVISAVNDIANASNGLKLAYYAVNYRPFLSMFNMTGVVADGSLPEAFGVFYR